MSNSTPLTSLAITLVRVVAHTMGPVSQGAQFSQNHWSIYLVVIGGGSVRLNMATNPAPSKQEGIFTVTRHQYDLTQSCVQSWDFRTRKPTTVGDILSFIARKRRQNYRMTASGVGCRHWVFTIIQDMVAEGVLEAHAVSQLSEVLPYNYSRNQVPVPLQILNGAFF